MKKILERQKITINSVLFLAVHKYNHWIFLKMENGLISVYDSLVLRDVQGYLDFPLIKKIVDFS